MLNIVQNSGTKLIIYACVCDFVQKKEWKHIGLFPFSLVRKKRKILYSANKLGNCPTPKHSLHNCDFTDFYLLINTSQNLINAQFFDEK